MNLEVIKNDFYEKGWCKVSDFFDPSFIKEIEKALHDFVIDKVDDLITGEIHYVDKYDQSKIKQINSIHVLSVKSKFFKDLLFNEKVINLMEYILDDDVEPQWSQLFAKPARVGLAAPMHQDNYYWNVQDNRTVTLWMAIDEVFHSNAGVSYYEKSHKLGIIEHEESFAKGTSQKVPDAIINDFNKNSLITPTLEPGDILLHHGAVIHGSTHNLSDYDRRGMSMWYKAKSAEVNKEKLRMYEKSLQEQIGIMKMEK